MKKIFSLLVLSVLATFLFSCKDADTDPVLGLTTKGSVSANTTSIVLNEMIANDPVIDFTWTDPVFTTDIAEIRYLEFAKKGTNFSPNQVYLLPQTGNVVSITHLEMNNMMAALGIAPNQVSEVEVRLRSELNDANIYYSDPITLQVTPYLPNPDLIYPKINVPGSIGPGAGYGNWDPSNSFNLFSPESNQKYRGFIYVTDPNSEFKFTVNEDWPGNKGDASSTGNSGALAVDGANIKAANPGTFYIKVDWNGDSYTFDVANFGIIGDATPTGWGSDTDFVYNPLTKNWEIASINLNTTGVFKFRANNEWLMKFQPASADQTVMSGSAIQTFLSSEGTVSGDPSYKVNEAGNYKVVLDLHNSAYYKLTLTKL